MSLLRRSNGAGAKGTWGVRGASETDIGESINIYVYAQVQADTGL